jgi:hypothetical protein
VQVSSRAPPATPPVPISKEEEAVALLGNIFQGESKAARREINSGYVGRGRERELDDDRYQSDDDDDIYKRTPPSRAGASRSRSHEKKRATEKKIPTLKQEPSTKRALATSMDDAAGSYLLAIRKEEKDGDEEAQQKKSKLHDRKPMNEG